MILLTAVVLLTFPLWLLVAAALSPLVKGRLRPLRLLWIALLHMVLESLILLEMFGLWIASGFGLWIRRPFFERIHYDLAPDLPGDLLPRGPPRAPAPQIVTQGPTPDAHPGRAAARRLPPRRAR